MPYARVKDDMSVRVVLVLVCPVSCALCWCVGFVCLGFRVQVVLVCRV
jgi:hypothetical protein